MRPGRVSKTQMIKKKWILKNLDVKKEKIPFLLLPELFLFYSTEGLEALPVGSVQPPV